MNYSLIYDNYLNFCQYFGFFIVVVFSSSLIFRTLKYFWNTFIKRGVEWCPGTWAIVTGATDGIGLEYARQLAEKGYNLLLLSRSLEKLNKVKNEISEEHKNCEVRVMAVDFTSTDIYEKIAIEFLNLDEIHVLVNNVGMGPPNDMPQYFSQISEDFMLDMINVNVIACTRLTALVLPFMESKGRGVIINMSSFSGVHPLPLATIYSSTKAYMDFFSRGLSKEYKDKGIIVQSLVPFFIKTKMFKNVGSAQPLTIGPKAYVKSALKTVGKINRCTGCFYFTIFNLGYDFIQWIAIMWDIDIVTKLNYSMFKRLSDIELYDSINNNIDSSSSITIAL